MIGDPIPLDLHRRPSPAPDPWAPEPEAEDTLDAEAWKEGAERLGGAYRDALHEIARAAVENRRLRRTLVAVAACGPAWLLAGIALGWLAGGGR